ncbi:5938_t:CDS:2 [Paraglomus occultum]|uniref:5938_t:CDS:1 n=1 Tax=Paraglomus occultum TaxID=144539 RepID=A0A9N9B7Y4_9GLOM|nr:5938_t:CDS:2 [Paraglomus occultum]
MKSFIFSSVALLVCLTPATYSWGSEGHRTVGRIAQNFLTSDVSNQVATLLGPSDTLESVSTWADIIKRDPMWTWSARLHFIDTQDDPTAVCNVDETEIALLEATIANYTTQLDSSNGFSSQERNIALKFLTHFFGDITQPLHVCGKELGGNQHLVTFDGRSTNLHAIWDTDMIRKRLTDFSSSPDNAVEAYAANLTDTINSGNYKDISSGWVSCIGASQDAKQCPLQWATDSDALNCQVVWGYVLANPDVDLDGEYYNSVVPSIDLQLAKAGYRLGTFLNQLLGKGGAKFLLA